MLSPPLCNLMALQATCIQSDEHKCKPERRTCHQLHPSGPLQLPAHHWLYTSLPLRYPTLRYNMQQLQLLEVFSLILLVLNPSQCSPISGHCAVDQDASSFCIPSLEEYYAQVNNQPYLLNERSLAAWTYERKVDLSRVPQVIFEAKCITSHSCKGVDSAFSVESVPISIRMPVLRKSPDCLFHSVDFESVNIACICATTRKN